MNILLERRLHLAAVVLLCTAGNCDRSGVSLPSFVVVTLNMEGGGRHYGESERETLERYQTISREIRSREGFWNLIGYTELRYHRDDHDLPNYVLLEDDEFECPQGSYHKDGAECMGHLLSAEHAEGHSALGFNVNVFLEYVPGSILETFIGDRSTVGNHIHRTVLGARIKSRSADVIIPFYVTHLSATPDADRHRKEIKDLITFIKSNVHSGDAPPVLVGDFNCGHPEGPWPADVQALLNESFVDATAGPHDVMRIYVGRPQAFRSARVFWRMPTPGDFRMHPIGHPNIIDHRTFAATLRMTDTLTEWPVPTATVGCRVTP